MKWSSWKLGLAVAFFVAFADGLSSVLITDHPIWKNVIALAVVKGIGGAALFLRQHPTDVISPDATVIKKEDAK